MHRVWQPCCQVDKSDDNSRTNSAALRLSGTRKLFWLEDVYVTGLLAARLDDVRLVNDNGFNGIRRRQLRVLSMSRPRFPFQPSTDAEPDVSRESLPVGGTSEEDEINYERLAEACWYLHEAITVHDLTAKELIELWGRLMTTMSRTAAKDTSRTDVDKLCSDGRRQQKKRYGPLSADQAETLDDDERRIIWCR